MRELAFSTIKEMTRPRSSGQPTNMHSVSARRKIEPNYERMKALTQSDKATKPEAV